MKEAGTSGVFTVQITEHRRKSVNAQRSESHCEEGNPSETMPSDRPVGISPLSKIRHWRKTKEQPTWKKKIGMAAAMSPLAMNPFCLADPETTPRYPGTQAPSTLFAGENKHTSNCTCAHKSWPHPEPDHLPRFHLFLEITVHETRRAHTCSTHGFGHDHRGIHQTPQSAT